MGQSSTAFDFIELNRPFGGEGGIRTHGAVTRTTVFETALLLGLVCFLGGSYRRPGGRQGRPTVQADVRVQT